jgi:hypothetical protein
VPNQGRPGRATGAHAHAVDSSPVNSEIADTWTSRELPILQALLHRFDAGEQIVDLETIRAELDMRGPQLLAASTALRDADPPYIELELSSGWTENSAGGVVTRVYERTRRELGSWPSPEAMLNQLVVALEDASESEAEPERKGRLRAAAETLGGMARDLAVDVMAARLGRIG